MSPLRVLILGSGGREHALAWSVQKSPLCEKVFVSPGNDGIREVGFSTFDFSDFVDLKMKVLELGVNLIIPGSETYLAGGICDFDFGPGVQVFGPTKKLAQVETSKAWAKKIMSEAQIPTAVYQAVNSISEAIHILEANDWSQGVVVKADGLAAGKGVVVCQNREQAILALKELGSSVGEKFVIEERLEGREFSAFVIVHENQFLEFGSACDYKKRTSDSRSPNTGGMGAFAPCDWFDVSLLKKLVWEPLFNEFKKQGLTYTGFLYAGLMVTSQGIKVIEFNARLGDPETQALLPILQSDLLSLILGHRTHAEFKNSLASVHVVLVHPDYPKEGTEDRVLKGSLPTLTETTNNYLFFSALQKVKDGWKISRGRGLGVTAVGESRGSAREKVYSFLKTGSQGMNFNGCDFREDIGQ